MNKSQIIELYGYNDWANFKLLEDVSHLENKDFIQDLSSSYSSIRDTMVHILGAEELWLSRWMGEQGRTLLNHEEFPSYEALARRCNHARNQFQNFLVSLTEEDLRQEISYKNLKEISYTLELWKQMVHVTHHSTYHRGQVVTMLRQLGKQPPSLDLIYYYLGER